MGKKGTKRKTKWRALPLAEEAGGSGNEEELLDEDTSTTSSVVGQPPITYKKQAIFYKVGDKPFKPNRRFPYDRYKSKGPLVKLESKTFDEEEYTKISTPRQDVLFKKGYFGRKRESSVEGTSHNSGETEGDEPMMDQLIITNGFVDERGHYLVNGNSYEIYDPYSNTVTVVVGPPPYTSGVTQPVLAAVSCQPVPLQPVDWFPPGSDWPSQGSAWTPSFPQNYMSETINSPNQNCENDTGLYGPDAQISNLYHQPPYFAQGYVYNEPPAYNGIPIQSSDSNHTTKNLCSDDNDSENKLKKTRRKSVESNSKDENQENTEEKENKEISSSRNECPTTVENNIEEKEIKEISCSRNECSTTAHNNSDLTAMNPLNEESLKEPVVVEPQTRQQDQIITNCLSLEIRPKEDKEVEKESHSTQTTLLEAKENPTPLRLKVPEKESHSTQTVPEETFPNNKTHLATEKNNQKNQSNNINNNNNNNSSNNNNNNSNINNNNNGTTNTILSSPVKGENESKMNWKTQHNKYKEYYNSLPKKNSEEPCKKVYQRRTNFIEDRKHKIENFEKAESISLSSPLKISYAKKAMVGLENKNDKNTKIVNCTSPTFNNKITNDLNNTSALPVICRNNQNERPQVLTNNETNRRNYVKQVSADRLNSYEEKKNMNGNIKNGFTKPRYDGNSSVNKNSNERNSQKNFKYKEKKVQLKPLEMKFEKYSKNKEKCEEVVSDSKSQSEKSSTTSELSSPTELSSGQNTPPEKLIVKKMEQKIAKEINKSFEEKLKQNLTENKSNEKESEEDKVEEESETPQPVEINEKDELKVEGKKKKKNKAKAEVEKPKETSRSNKRKKKKAAEESKEKSESDNFGDNLSFLPKFIKEKSDDLFESWSGLKDHPADLISEINQDLAEDCEILKSLGINEDKISFSKLPLHSDLLMMLPNFGWSRPKLRIEDIFAPTKHLQDDLFTRRNIISMKSTKPEEFFASVVDNPITNSDKTEKKKEGSKPAKKDQGKVTESHSNKNDQGKDSAASPSPKSAISKKIFNLNKTGYKTNKVETKNKVLKEEKEDKKDEKENKEINGNLGIVDAVTTWLQEQGGSEKVISANTLSAHILDNLSKSEEDLHNTDDAMKKNEEELDQKNEISNPMHALSGSNGDSVSIADFRGNSECIRVANVINDGFRRVSKEFFSEKKNPFKNNIFRSSSWDAKLSDASLKKHFKFLTDSASFCQDLISDVRNGLPVKNEYATEELCDPKQSVRKYYTLSPNNHKLQHQKKIKQVNDSDDSENEVFDALEYKFLKETNIKKQNEKRQSSERNGNVSITDSGVHSDLELSEDALSDQQKEASCKLQ